MPTKKNKEIAAASIADVYKQHGTTPEEELINMIMEVDEDGDYVHDAKFRARVHTEMLGYVTAKPKAIDIDPAANDVKVIIQHWGLEGEKKAAAKKKAAKKRVRVAKFK